MNLGSTPPLLSAQPTPEITCADPARPNIVYVTGSTNMLPLLQAVAPLMAADDPAYLVVFQPQTSCRGAAAMFDPDPSRQVIKDIPGNWAFFFDGQGIKHYCRLSPEGDRVDVGESDVYARTCGYDPKPGIADYTGPIQAITFVVPAGSSQRSISAEAAHILFGAGGAQGALAPWTDPRMYFVRSAGTGTIQLTSRAINVPPNAWWGIDRLSSDNLRDSMEVIDPGVAEKAIGVLSSDFADRARANLRILSFQGTGQSLRLPARLVADLLRQGQRARRPLPHLGAHPPVRRDHQRRALGRRRRAGEAVLGAAPGAEADRRHRRRAATSRPAPCGSSAIRRWGP